MRTSLRTQAIAVTTAAFALAATAVPAWAAPASAQDPTYRGTVISDTPLKVRQETNTNARVLRTLAPGTVLDGILCKQRGQKVLGNDEWYLIRIVGEGDLGGEWVSARYVRISGPHPVTCGEQS